MAYHLYFDGSNDSFSIPSIPHTHIVMDVYWVKMISEGSSSSQAILGSSVYEYMYDYEYGAVGYSGISSLKINGTSVSLEYFLNSGNSRLTAEFTVASGTRSLYLFRGQYGNYSKGYLYDVKIYNGTTLMAHYDIANTGDGTDVSGNGYHATISGATTGGTAPVTGTDGSIQFDTFQEIYDGTLGSITFDTFQELYMPNGSPEFMQIYKASDESLISQESLFDNAIALSLQPSLNESKEMRLLLRNDPSFSIADVIVSIEGTTANKWQLAPDNNGVAGTYLSVGTSLTIGTVGGVEGDVYFWVKASSSSDEVIGNDDSVVIVATGMASAF